MSQQSVAACLHSNDDVSVRNSLSKVQEILTGIPLGQHANEAVLNKIANELLLVETQLSYYGDDVLDHAVDVVSICIAEVSKLFLLETVNLFDDLKVHDCLSSVVLTFSWCRLVLVVLSKSTDDQSSVTKILTILLDGIIRIATSVSFDPMIEMVLFETLGAILADERKCRILIQNNRSLRSFLQLSLSILQTEHQEKLVYILQALCIPEIFEEIIRTPRLLGQMMKRAHANLNDGNLLLKARINTLAFICKLIFKYHPKFTRNGQTVADFENTDFRIEALVDRMVDYQAKVTMTTNYTLLTYDLNAAYQQYVTSNSLGPDFRIQFP